MNQVAKLVLVDNQDMYLLLYRSAHPIFGNDPDLPGGTVEDGESPLEAMVREVYEEAGVVITPSAARQLYQGTEYSTHDTQYSLYVAKLVNRPEVTLSWEHSAYEWLSREDFLTKLKNTDDTFMGMAYERLKLL